jgi:PAS domain-containing protein
MGSCELCFRSWRRRLECEPELWLIRCVSSHLVWRNAATRAWLNLTAEIDLWDNSIRWACPQDVPQIEHAFSNALKTLQPAACTARIKVQPHRYTLVRCYISPYRCHVCPRQCALLIYLVVPVDDPAP